MHGQPLYNGGFHEKEIGLMRSYFCIGSVVITCIQSGVGSGRKLADGVDEEFEWEEAADYRPEADSFHTELVRGVILKVIEEKEEADPFTNETIRNQTLYVRITSGAFKGKEIEAYNHGVSNPAFQINVTEGSRVILALEMENGEIVQTYIADYLREPQVYTLAAFFVILLLAIGWRKGAKALCSLLITLVLVWWS